MAYKKQLRDKDGNVIYPDVGLNLDDAVYSDDPTEPVDSPEPWIEPGDVDWQKFGIIYTVSDTEISLGRYDTTIDSLTITEAGKYAIFAYGQSGHGDNLLLLSIRKNGSVLAAQNGHGSYIQHTSLFCVSNCSVGDTITLVGYANNTASTKYNHGLIALRIG